ncbi:MAG: hypothetical protein RIC55_05385 [Pirellulaceae bacterium]
MLKRALMGLPLLTLAACLAPKDGLAAEPTRLPLHGDTVFQLASIQQGRELMLEQDAFSQSLSRFDRQSRLDTQREVTTEELLQFAAQQVLPWTDEDARRVAEVTSSLRTKLEPLGDIFPAEVLLIHTTGRGEGDAAYTRGNAVILPTRKLRQSAAGLERLLIHELFHILSRHDPALRKRLYDIVGFELCEAIPLPGELIDRKITNPDAPRIDSVIRLSFNGQAAVCAPVLIASSEQYEPGAERGFFKYLQFRLMEVQPHEGGFAPKRNDGEPVLREPQDADDFFEQIGRNTRYIIHPDEILADNFVHLVKKSGNLDTPRIIEAMARELTPP